MSVASEMTRISNALDAVSTAKSNIAEAITAKGVDTLSDASFDTLVTNIGLIESGVGGASNLVVDTTASATSGVYTASSPLITVSIPNYTTSKKYFLLVEAGDDVDRTALSSSNPAVEFVVGLFSGTAMRNTFKLVAATFRNQGSTTALFDNVLKQDGDTIFKNGSMKIYSYSSNVYTRFGTGTYRIRIYEI